MADIDLAFAKTANDLQAARTAFEGRLAHQQADDRSRIARSIVRAFIWLMYIVVIAILVGLFYFGDWAKISEPAKFLVTLLSSVMLPVVTLVIGHYFGSK